MVSFRTALAGLCLGAVAQLPSCLAYPATNSSLGYTLNHDGLSNREDDGKPFWLRIMPLGASITAGTNGPDGSDGNGYRKYLRDQLRFDGWEVNMVGTFTHGTMADSDHEGVPGDVVSKVEERTKNACHTWRPNVVLINAGTNDAKRTVPVSQTALDMRRLIDDVFAEVPNAVVVLSTLLPTKDEPAGAMEKARSINAEYRALVGQYVPDADADADDIAFKVMLAELDDGQFITLADIHDGTHPTDKGNQKMAAVWHSAIQEAERRGWLSEPSSTGEFEDGDTKEPTCRKEYGSGNDDPRAGRWVLSAADERIHNDGKYKHGGTLSNVKGTFEGEKGARLWMAQIFNHGLPKLGAVAELVFVEGDSDDRKIWWRKNNGGGNLESAKEITTITDGCKTRGIHWGDVNGDGLDDFICIAQDGEMWVWINDAANGEEPRFRQLAQSYKKPEMGLGQDHVRLGDIDGDGRLDYCVVTGAGYIHCWRNGGTGEYASYWQDMGIGDPIFNPKGMGDIRGVRFADINGDGRDDWLWLSEEGEVTTWINQRGVSKTMRPYWLEAEWNPTHAGVDEDIGEDRWQVQFGRFFGSGKSDYLFYTVDTKTSGTREVSWKIWENTGKGGGKYQKGDGAYWGDMTNNGVDDYIWISPEGKVTIFRNKNSASQNDGYLTGPWNPGVSMETGKDRRGLHIGDWDGDGHADIIYADRKTGSLTVWLTTHKGKGDFSFDKKTIPNSNKCSLGWGLLYTDHAAHFADISGSGKVDYLCMGVEGRTTAWIRDKDDGWDSIGTNVGQVKFAEEWDRANLRFADADGDGRADLIWTDKFSGDGWVWYNLGPGKPEDLKGSSYEWESRKKVYLGSSRGPNMHFPNLGGQGRADMVGMNPISGKGQAWFNSCPRGGDDGEITDPGLPAYNPDPVDPPPSDDDHWFCDVDDSSWGASDWNEHAMGEWLLNRISLYEGLDADWPRPEGQTQDVGIPRIIGSYDGLKRDGLFTWPAGCRNINSEDGCNLSGSDLREEPNCKLQPERAFALWAMRNLASFMDTWESLLTDSSLIANMWTADMAKKFMFHSTDSNIANANAWATIVAGAFTGVGSFIPGLGSLAANAVAGIGTIAAGAVAFAPSPVEDARFDNFAELGTKLGNHTLMVSMALTSFYNELFSETPGPDATLEEAQRLGRLLESGFWASMDAGGATGSTDTKYNVVSQIRASIIAEVWNAEHVGIIKWSDDSEFTNVFGFSPCFGDKETYGMGHAVACLNGANYIITPMHHDDNDAWDRVLVGEWPDIGQDSDTLSGYNLSPESLIRAAERTQRILGTYQPREMNGIVTFINDWIDNWDGDPTDHQSVMAALRFFNVPVCDLDGVGSFDMPNNCEPVSGRLHNDYKKECAIALMSTGCTKVKLDGQSWPYGEGPDGIIL